VVAFRTACSKCNCVCVNLSTLPILSTATESANVIRCSLNVTEDGKKALITLANGDMRKVLNILQVMNSILPL